MTLIVENPRRAYTYWVFSISETEIAQFRRVIVEPELPQFKIGQRIKSKKFINARIKIPPEWAGEVLAVEPSLQILWEATGDITAVSWGDIEDAYICRS